MKIKGKNARKAATTKKRRKQRNNQISNTQSGNGSRLEMEMGFVCNEAKRA
jgi:hypothetical protein